MKIVPYDQLKNADLNIDCVYEGGKETSRLISRLRYRQFGIFVTTSYFASQAYEEVISDAHPVILICANDIIKILKNAGHDTPGKVRLWLETNFKS